jgi:broad specificity phosphatase PhoE
MVRIVLVRPGQTDFAEQGRIAGTLDLPLSEAGTEQASHTATELSSQGIELVFTSPCQAAMETAECIARELGVKVKKLDKLRNIDQGLWQGKLIEEVRHKQPKVYRQWQENPESVCPPEGESLAVARGRVEASLAKVLKRRNAVVALVAPEPLASLIRNIVDQSEIGDLWKAESCSANWQLIECPSPAGTQ